jgi:hypothetical protein
LYEWRVAEVVEKNAKMKFTGMLAIIARFDIIINIRYGRDLYGTSLTKGSHSGSGK